MATFTMSLKRAIELTGGTTELMSNGVTRLIGGDIGLQYYPIHTPEYRDTLTGKIVDHYWNREIGFETIDIFKMKMRTRMNEIMEYYNQLYESKTIAFDPMRTMDIQTIVTGESLQNVTAESESNANSESGNENRTVQYDLPQVALSPNKDYATAGVDTTGTGTADSTSSEANSSSSDTSNASESQVVGYQGSPSDLLMRYRETLLNIDMAIINDLEELFMLVYDNGDTYTNSESRHWL